MRRSAASPRIEVVPVVAETWHLFEQLLGPDGLQGGCWCAYFRMSAREFGQSSPQEHREQACQTVDENRPFGLIALIRDVPQGWVAVSPRLDNPRLAQSMVAHVDAEEDLAGVWSVTCFYTDRSTRRTGLTGVLLEEAVQYANNHGARTVEGYPVDASDGRRAAADLYHGELQTFLHCGFQLVGRRGTRRAFVRKTL